MKRTLKLFVLAMLVISTVCAFAVMANATETLPSIPAEGSSDGIDGVVDEITWTFDSATGTLKISNVSVWEGPKVQGTGATLTIAFGAYDMSAVKEVHIVNASCIQGSVRYNVFENLEKVVFGPDTTGLQIRTNCFTGCSNLKEIDFGTVTGSQIQAGAFTGTALTKVTIPSDFGTVAAGAFDEGVVIETKKDSACWNALVASGYTPVEATMPASGQFASGTAGEEYTAFTYAWTFADGTLTLSYVSGGQYGTWDGISKWHPDIEAYAADVKKIVYAKNADGKTIPCTAGATHAIFTNLEEADLSVLSQVRANAFKDCANLTTVTLNSASLALEAGAFANTGITSVTFPDNTTFRGNGTAAGTKDNIFGGQEVTITATEGSTAWTNFEGGEGITLTAPSTEPDTPVDPPVVDPDPDTPVDPPVVDPDPDTPVDPPVVDPEDPEVPGEPLKNAVLMYTTYDAADPSKCVLNDGKTNDLVWAFDEATGVLTISGTSTTLSLNPAPNWNAVDNYPWNEHKSAIKKVVIDAPITKISTSYALANMANLETIVLPGTTIEIVSPYCIFGSNSNLKKVCTAENEDKLPDYTFDLRTLSGTAVEILKASAKNQEITVLLPVSGTAIRLESADDAAKSANDFQDIAKVTFKYVAGSESEATASAFVALNDVSSTVFAMEEYTEDELNDIYPDTPVDPPVVDPDPDTPVDPPVVDPDPDTPVDPPVVDPEDPEVPGEPLKNAVLMYTTYDAADPTKCVLNDGKTNDLVWAFDEATGVLTISGTSTTLDLNPAPNWNAVNNYPWNEHKSAIKKVVIEAPITKIADNYAFANMANVETIVLPGTTISVDSFYCIFGTNSNLKKVCTAENEDKLPDYTFDLRTLSGTAVEILKTSAKNQEITVLLPVSGTAIRLESAGDAAKSANDFQDIAKVTFKYVAGSESEATASAFVALNDVSSTVFAMEEYTEDELNDIYPDTPVDPPVVDPDPDTPVDPPVVDPEPELPPVEKQGTVQDGKSDYTWTYGGGVLVITTTNAWDGIKSLPNDIVELAPDVKKLIIEGSSCIQTTPPVSGQPGFYSVFKAMEEVDLGTVSQIRANSFNDCTALKTVNVSKATEIGSGAFANTAITEITIPASVSKVASDAFTGCTVTVTTPNGSAAWVALKGQAGVTLKDSVTGDIYDPNAPEVDPDKPTQNLQETKVTNILYGVPVVDGQLDEVWSSAEAVDFPYDRNNSDAVADKLAGEYDYGDSQKPWVKTLWDGKNLYVYFRVYDDNIVATGSNAKYLLDSVELYFDENNDKSYDKADAERFFQICVVAGVNTADANATAIATVLGDGYYDVEMSVAFDSAKKAGDVIGIDFAINAVDEAGTRAHSLSWNDRTNTTWKAPVYMGEAVLGEVPGAGDPVEPTEPIVWEVYGKHWQTGELDVTKAITFTYDPTTKILTVTGGNVNYDCSFTSGFDAEGNGINAWKTIKETYGDVIKEIHVISTNKLTVNDTSVNAFADMPELEKFIWNGARSQNNLLTFANSSKLSTFGPEGTPEGTADLRNWKDLANGVYALHSNLFAGTAIERLILPVSGVTTIDANAFNGCKALAEIYIPANTTVTSVAANAFAGCTGDIVFRLDDSSKTPADYGFTDLEAIFPDAASVTVLSFTSGTIVDADGNVIGNWSVNPKSGVLSITADGEISDMSAAAAAIPEDITVSKITFSDGVTAIADNALAAFTDVTTVEFDGMKAPTASKPFGEGVTDINVLVNAGAEFDDTWCGFTVEKLGFMFGDVDGSGSADEPDIADLVRLAQYLASWDVTINEAAADVNGDGKVNVRDLVLLSQYLAGWNVGISGGTQPTA